jgi:hydroxylamine reductase
MIKLLKKAVNNKERSVVYMENKMFCYQCQETAGCKGCTQVGVCGKSPQVAAAQDELIYMTKQLAAVTTKLRDEGKLVGREINHYITWNLFTTITNANFSETAIRERVKKTRIYKEELQKNLTDTNLQMSVREPGVLITVNEDVRSLRELITYGLKGICAYMKHANVLDKEQEKVDIFVQSTLAKLLDDGLTVDDLIALVMETGKYGVDGMALLDEANTSAYGNPEMTTVDIGVGKNPGILISGHDLKDIEMLLTQTEETGVDVYTHSEMLPAHYYPAFKKYKHFVGNYGNAWWKQKEEFESFNGPILMTTNCIVPPKASYKERLFTTGSTGMDGCKYIAADANGHKDFSELIALAKLSAAPTEIETGSIVGGFAHAQVFALADKVVEAVKSGAIKKFFVMAGCDGRMKSRSYYTEFAQALPKDAVILTAGCAKYRYNKLNLGTIGGIPRVLDAGQCNDSYSLVLIALKLKEVFGLDDVNDLPIAYNIAWYEQKAVIVLLALLYLGVKNIHLGPTLPAFLSPNVAKVLIEKFGIAPITDVENDLSIFYEK